MVEYLFKKGGIEYDITYVDQEAREAPSFRAMSPRGQIPVLILPEGQVMTESLAIVMYLLDQHPEIGLLPQAIPQRVKTLQWLSFLAINLYTANQRYYQTTSFHGDPDVIKAGGFDDRNAIYVELEAALTPYLAGEQITAADLYLYMLLTWDRTLVEVLARHPKLKQFYKTMRDQPYVKAVNQRQPPK